MKAQRTLEDERRAQELLRDQADARRLQAQLDAESNRSALGRRTAGWIVSGAGLSLVGVSWWCADRAGAKKMDIIHGNFATGSDISTAVTSVNTYRGLEIASAIVGGTAVITGFFLIVLSPNVSQSRPTVGLQIVPGPNSITIRGRWQ